MAKYRKRSDIVIEAEVYREGLEDGFEATCDSLRRDFCQNNCNIECSFVKPYIKTLEGKLYINKGDYIVTGIRGERYPVRADIFMETYEEVD